MNAPPPEAIQSLRKRLTQLRGERTELTTLYPFDRINEKLRLDASIQETEALIKRLENPHAPRHP